MRTVHGIPYTSSVKPKWRPVIFWVFAARSSDEASPPREHSKVEVSKCCEGFVAIWFRAREEFTDNRFQLLFIILAELARLRRASTAMARRTEILVLVRTVHGSLYTFSVKLKWRTVVCWFFVARSSAEAYFRSSPPGGHSTVRVLKRCEGFVAIWLRAREEFADNRFQLLFICIDR